MTRRKWKFKFIYIMGFYSEKIILVRRREKTILESMYP